MTPVSFEPHVGDMVSVHGHYGNFQITAVTPCIDNWRISEERGWADLEEIKTKFPLRNIPWSALNMQEIIARRIIEKIKERGDFPDSLSGYFSIESGLDHENNPALYVSFDVNSGVDKSQESVSELTTFRHIVGRELREERLLQWWPYIQFTSARDALDVAS